MTLYRVLSGRDPQTPEQLMEMRQYSPRYFNKNISPETERLIAVATAPEAGWRYQNIADFLADLQGIRAPEQSGYLAPPFTFADGSRARNATDLARLVERKPDESLSYLQNGMFAAWLQQNGFAAGAQTANEVSSKLREKPARALELLRRALYPSGTGGVFPHVQVAPAAVDFGEVPSGASVQIEMRIRNTGSGLAWGTIALEAVPTLNTAPRGQDAPQPPSVALPGLQLPAEWEGNDVRFDVVLDTSRVPSGKYSGAILIQTDSETARIPVSYSITPLDLTIEPEKLEFGIVPVGEKYSKSIRLRTSQPQLTSTTGKPRGTVYIGPSLHGLAAPERFEGENVEIVVDATAPGMIAGEYSGVIQLDTNGGRFRVPVSYVLALSPGRMLGLVLGFVLGGAAIACAARYLYGLVNPEYSSSWLLLAGNRSLPTLAPYQFGPGPVFFGILATLFLSQLLAHTIEKNRTRKKSDPTLRPTLGCLFLCFSAPFGWGLTFILHYIFWGFGDWLLHPLESGVLSALPPENAPLAWGAAGALGGLVWGTSRALSSIGATWARYAAAIALPLVFLGLLLNAMLATGG
jgi:hypothetical protein